MNCISRTFILSAFFSIFSLFHLCSVESWNDSSIDMHLLKEAWKWPGGGSRGKPYYRLNVNGVYFDGERDWVKRWRFIENRVEMKDKAILELGCNVAIASAFMIKYGGAKCAVGIELPDERLRIHGNPMVVKAAKLLHKALNVSTIQIRQMDFDVAHYEQLLGTNYDIVICMSFLRWMKNPERLMKYLSNFNEVIFEGHESDQIEIKKFKKYGFNQFEILGSSVVGISSPENYKRTVIRFWKG